MPHSEIMRGVSGRQYDTDPHAECTYHVQSREHRTPLIRTVRTRRLERRILTQLERKTADLQRNNPPAEVFSWGLVENKRCCLHAFEVQRGRKWFLFPAKLPQRLWMQPPNDRGNNLSFNKRSEGCRPKPVPVLEERWTKLGTHSCKDWLSLMPSIKQVIMSARMEFTPSAPTCAEVRKQHNETITEVTYIPSWGQFLGNVILTNKSDFLRHKVGTVSRTILIFPVKAEKLLVKRCA